MDTNAKMREALTDEAFVKTLLEAENEEAVQKLLADKGVEMQSDEIRRIASILSEMSPEQLEQFSQSDELSEDALEQVAGGDVLAAVSAVGLMAIPIFGLTIGILEANGVPVCEKLRRW